MTKNELKRQQQVDLAQRLREVREDMYGEYGGEFLADALEVPLQSWLNYESGVMVPADVILKLIVLARINPDWLLTGQGDMYNY